MSDHVWKVRSIDKILKIIEFQLTLKNETKVSVITETVAVIVLNSHLEALLMNTITRIFLLTLLGLFLH